MTTKTIEQLREEYAATVKAIRAILPDWKEMNSTINFKAIQAADDRLSASHRFYTGSARAMKAKAAGEPYPEESLPQPGDYVVAAKQALAFAQWFKENGLDELPDDVRF